MNASLVRSPYAIYDHGPPCDMPVLDLDPFSDAYFDDPYDAMEEMRDAGPVIWLSRYSIAAVARHEEVREALSNWRMLSSARGVGMEDFDRHGRFRLPSLILEADPPEHSRARGVLSAVLSPPVLKQIRADIERKAEMLVDQLLERRRFDAVADLACAFPLAVFPNAIGLPLAGREKLLPHAEALFNSFGPRNELFKRSAAQADFAAIQEQGRKENLLPGGLGMKVHAAAERVGYPPDQSAMLVRALLQAGLDTTINAIGAAIYCLARFPDQWRKLRASPDLARNAFEEAIRYESPVQTFFRTTVAPITLGAAPLREGEKVLMLLGAANRDPRRWDEPDRYDIERKTLGHVGFGAGIHLCVGQLLARMEGEVLLKAMARRIETISIVDPPVRQYNNTLRGLAKLPVEINPA